LIRYIVLIFNENKVRASSASGTKSTVPDQQPAPKSSRVDPMEILKLKRQRNAGSQSISVEMEVDQYLSDSNEGTGTLEFWQVVQFSYLINYYFC
jgi:hypothetical protein